MKDQLRLLSLLQNIDTRATELRKSIETLPARLAPAKQDLAKLEDMLTGERTKLEETEKWRLEQEDLVKREEEAVREAKVKLQQSRNTKDFAAASREIDNKRRAISDREDELVKVIDAMAASASSLEQREQDVDGLREKITSEDDDVSGKVAALAKELQECTAGRSELAAQVPPPLLKRYETIQKRRGIALVPVIDGVCKGCFITLPPQLSNIIARNESLESCPSCHRLLFRPDMLNPADETAD